MAGIANIKLNFSGRTIRLLQSLQRTIEEMNTLARVTLKNARDLDRAMSGRDKRYVAQDGCEKCILLSQIYCRTPETDRDYWLMTELFVMLHDGSDVCKGD